MAFLYRWTHIPTKKWYIGSRTAKGCHPGDGYICSSRTVKPMIQQCPEDWVRTVLCFGDVQEILELEIALLTKLDAARDIMSWNKVNGINNFKMGPHSEEHKAALREAWKTRPPLTQEAKDKMSKSKLGHPVDEETRKKIGSANKGRVKPPEQRARMSASAKGKPWSEARRNAQRNKHV